MKRSLLILPAILLVLPVTAGELPLPMAAKLLQLISKGAGENGRIACKSPEMAAELAKIGSEVAPAARIAWAANDGEIKILALQRKCVVASSPNGLNLGAALAIYEDGGKPKIAINAKNLSASGVSLSDAIIKAAVQ